LRQARLQLIRRDSSLRRRRHDGLDSSGIGEERRTCWFGNG
jgi:hypothetical protein